MKQLIKFVALLVLTAALAIGIPAGWFWVGGQIGGGHTPGEYLSTQTFAAILPGMILTYVIVLDIASRFYRRSLSPEELRRRGWPARRASWSRSMRDEPARPGTAHLNGIEVAFVLAAIAASIAFQIWFLFFAGSPI